MFKERIEQFNKKYSDSYALIINSYNNSNTPIKIKFMFDGKDENTAINILYTKIDVHDSCLTYSNFTTLVIAYTNTDPDVDTIINTLIDTGTIPAKGKHSLKIITKSEQEFGNYLSVMNIV